MEDKSIGLVLGGGASKGSWQAGALMALIEKFESYPWNYIVGVSVGALNGAMLAVGKDPTAIWRTLETEKVYKKFGKLRIALRVLQKKDSVYSTEPLRDLIEEHLLGEIVQTKMIFVATDVLSGRCITVTWEPGSVLDRHQLDLLRASASMPILFDPVDTVFTMEPSKLVDGGLRQINPIGTALAENPDKLYIILCGPPEIDPKDGVDGIMEFAGRTVDIFLNEIFNSDLDQFFTINDLVLQAQEHGVRLRNRSGTRDLKYFSSELFYPYQDLGDGMDFSSGLMNERLDAGYNFVAPIPLKELND